MTIQTKRWSGSAWITAPVRRWSGSAWIDAYVRRWGGSSWIQIYPETIITTSNELWASTLNTYRSKWDNAGAAKQGKYSSYAAAHGYLGISAHSLPGSGNISSIGSSSFTGVRDGSGYYNNNQTVRFYRSHVNSTSQSPVNTLSGEWNSSTGGPGSGKTMSNRPVSVNGEMLNWLNGVSGKPYLYIHSGAAADYMGIISSFYIRINSYSYQAKMLSFEEPKAKGLQLPASVYKEAIGNEPYCHMVVYEDEVDMTLEEILQRREDGVVEDISRWDIDDAPDIKTWTREYEVTEIKNELNETTPIFRIETMNMGMDDVPQFSLNGEEWFNMQARPVEYDTYYVTGILPKDFNKYSDFIYFRVYDKEKDIVYCRRTIEPIIYLPEKNTGLILPGEEIDLSEILPPEEIMKYNK